MINTIIPHTFNESLIRQLSEETLINGQLVPKGYCNATEICQANNKRWAKYLEFSKTQPFLDALAEVSPAQGLTHVITISDGLNEYRGTWVSLPVAMNLAQWCSPKFAAWASIVLSAIVQGEFQPLTKEAAIAQQKLQELWQEIRDASKVAFWNLGDATKAYLDSHSNLSENYRRFIYSNCQDTVNRGILGKMANKIRSELEVTDLLRDHYKAEALERIQTVQRIAAIQIVNKGTEPLKAVKDTLEFCGYEVINYN